MFHTKLKRPRDLSAHDFYEIWAREAEASMEAVAAGVITAIWKVAGKDEVIGVMEVADPDALDIGLHELPIWKTGNSDLVDSIEWTMLRPYENWTENVRSLAEPSS